MFAPLPSWWQRAVKSSSQSIIIEAELWRPRFMEPSDPAYASAERVPLTVVDGRVDLDVTRSVVRYCNVELVDASRTITPDSTSDVLTPYGTELVLRRGFRWGASPAAPPSVPVMPVTSGLVGWFKADSLALADGAAVASWTDSSPAGNHATQGTAGARPTYVANALNGRPVLRFDAGDSLTTAMSAATKPRTIIAVVKPTDFAVSRTIIGGSTPNGSFQLRAEQTTGQLTALKSFIAGIGNSTGSIPAGTASLVAFTYGSAGEWAHFIGGAASGSGTNNQTFTASSTVIGAASAASAEFWLGDMAEIICFDRVLTAQEMADVTAYLQAKWFGIGGTVSASPLPQVAVPLGVFVLNDVDITEADAGTVLALTAYDRASRVAANKWRTPYVIPAGTNVALALADGLLDRWPYMPLDLAPTAAVTPQIVFDAGESSDPWRDFQMLAESAGQVLDISPGGAARTRVPADPGQAAPVATFAPGELSTLLSAGRHLSADGVFNGVVATGESSSVNTPVYGEAWDMDPASPTYRYGPFGERPYFYTSPLLTTNDQATVAASTVLQRILGQSERVEWTNLVDPALDGYDVVWVTADGVNVDAAYVVEALTYPLTAEESMTGRARSRRIG